MSTTVERTELRRQGFGKELNLGTFALQPGLMVLLFVRLKPARPLEKETSVSSRASRDIFKRWPPE